MLITTLVTETEQQISKLLLFRRQEEDYYFLLNEMFNNVICLMALNVQCEHFKTVNKHRLLALINKYVNIFVFYSRKKNPQGFGVEYPNDTI